MVRNTVYLKGILFFLLLFSFAISAQEVKIKTLHVDLSTEFGVLLTEIHFDEKNIELALRAEEIIKKDLIKIVNYFGYVPQSIVHINIDPYVKVANGNAAVFPANIINLFQVPPSNASHIMGIEDWFRGLLFHEYIHITQLDQTRGFWKMGRNIFGSIAKIPVGVVPTWLTEGIAVWGESHLISGGRLNYSEFNKEFLLFLKRKDACKEISCLDDPGSFPQRSLAYLAGAHFLEFIEKQKSGAIKCIVEKNSETFPFQLNLVFKECTGKDIISQYEDFKISFLKQEKNIEENNKFNALLTDSIENRFGADSFEAGAIFNKEILLKVEGSRYERALVSYDLEEKMPMLVGKFDSSLEDLSNFIETKEGDENNKLFLASFNDDPNYREYTKKWKIINAETLLVEKELHFKDNPQYVIADSLNEFTTANVVNLEWTIKKVITNQEGKVTESVNLVSLNNNQSIKAIRKIGNDFLVKIYENEENALYLLQGNNLKFLYKTSALLELKGVGANFFVIKDASDFKLIEITDDNMSISSLNQNVLNANDDFLVSPEMVVAINDKIQFSKIKEKDLLSFLKNNAGKSIVQLIKIEESTRPRILGQTSKIHSYPSLNHFLPHYWFLATGTGENVSSIGVRSEFFDPMFYNHLSAAFITYPSERKVGGNLEFNHRFMKNDLISTNFSANREYFKSNFRENLNEETEVTLSLAYKILAKKWTYIPALFVSYKDSTDFVTKSTRTSMGGSFLVNYNALSFHETFQFFRFYADVSHENAANVDSFVKMRSKIESKWRLDERLIVGLKTSYSKQFKDSFKGGVLFGGGASDYLNQRFHEFYGIPYSDVYGNEIFTLRLFGDYNLWNAYKGPGLFPLFLKEVHMLLGTEMMNADRIYIEKRGMLRSENVYSVFFGPRLKTNIFYYLPMDIDFIFAGLKAQGMDVVNTFEVSVNLELF